MSTDDISREDESRSTLREVLEQACAERVCSLGDLTVLSQQRDPYRLDTPANHRDGRWLGEQVARFIGSRSVHLRGLHYVLVTANAEKPDGTLYRNNDDNWNWLEEKAAKAARWLGYVGFDQIIDQRNAPPLCWEREEPVDPAPYVKVGVEVEIPEADELEPSVGIENFKGQQPYGLVFLGEKFSLDDVLRPLAGRYGADLYLPTGEMSDTLIYHIASRAYMEDRRTVVFYFADCDPAGWQMGISTGHKLRALADLEFGGLNLELRRVALTPDQVREHGLPSTPLKDTERRADDWLAKMGVEQTEIDALAALKPDLLREMAEAAVAPFYDSTLRGRVHQAERAWEEDAEAALAEQLDEDKLAAIRADAEGKLAELQDEVEAINDALRVEVGDDYELPEAVIPEPVIEVEPNGLPLVDLDDDFAEHAIRLRRSKAYEDGGDEQ
jgi:hypothetical protein